MKRSSSLRELRAFRLTTRSRAEVERIGALLVAHLGDGWTVRMWEGGGFHCAAVSSCGRWKVHPSFGRLESEAKRAVGAWRLLGFFAFLSPAGSDTNFGEIGDFGHTPESAIGFARATARGRLAHHAAMLELCAAACLEDPLAASSGGRAPPASASRSKATPPKRGRSRGARRS